MRESKNKKLYNKMGAHLKRLSAPKSWLIKRKIATFVTKPNPGTHSLNTCVSLNVLLRDMLGYARTTRESRKILNLNTVLIDCIRRMEVRFPVGLMDTVSISNIGKYYRLTMDKKGKIIAVEIDKSES